MGRQRSSGFPKALLELSYLAFVASASSDLPHRLLGSNNFRGDARPFRDNVGNWDETGYSTCRIGYWDCNFPGREANTMCSPYVTPYFSPQGSNWVLVPAAIVACCMAFGIGANDR
jgi:hypothetical protein